MQHFWGRLRNYRPHKNDTKRPEHLSMNSPDLLCQGVLQMTGSLASCGYYPFTRYSHLPGFTCGQFEDVYLVIITAKTSQPTHYSDVIMGGMASQITSLASVYSTAYSGIDQRKHQRSASLAFVRGIPRSPVNSPHKGPVTRKRFPFNDVIMWPVFSFPHGHGC